MLFLVLGLGFGKFKAVVCAQAMGTISGTLSQYPETCVIWVDAHADINTPETTDSGKFILGCSVLHILSVSLNFWYNL